MAIELGYQILSDVFLNTTIFGRGWILSILVTILTLLIITRDTNKWKELAFPVYAGWAICGLTPSLFIMIPLALICAIDVLSLEVVYGSSMGVLKSLNPNNIFSRINAQTKKSGKASFETQNLISAFKGNKRSKPTTTKESSLSTPSTTKKTTSNKPPKQSKEVKKILKQIKSLRTDETPSIPSKKDKVKEMKTFFTPTQDNKIEQQKQAYLKALKDWNNRQVLDGITGLPKKR